MIIKKKETPTNDSSRWTKSDRKTLKSMLKEGKTLNEIAKELGRTPSAVQYQKSVLGLSVKKAKSVKVKTPTGKSVDVNISPESGEVRVSTPKDKAKEMARVARGIARENGKRITMAMFFVEDL
jgi:hypothetical protein